jgi:hypothetical protein
VRQQLIISTLIISFQRKVVTIQPVNKKRYSKRDIQPHDTIVALMALKCGTGGNANMALVNEVVKLLAVKGLRKLNCGGIHGH